MDILDVSTEEISTIQTNILPESEVSNDESSWVIENVRVIRNSLGGFLRMMI